MTSRSQFKAFLKEKQIETLLPDDWESGLDEFDKSATAADNVAIGRITSAFQELSTIKFGSGGQLNAETFKAISPKIDLLAWTFQSMENLTKDDYNEAYDDSTIDDLADYIVATLDLFRKTEYLANTADSISQPRK